jgi:acetoin utilization protein AcuB
VLNKEILSVAISPLNPADTVDRALALMTDLRVAHLPVVADDKLVGLVSEDDLLNVPDEQAPLFQFENTFSKIVVQANSHFIEAVQCANEFNLTVVPVVNKESEYLGAITATDLLRHLGKITGVSDPGGVIVLELDKVNFSFSEISKLVETNDAQITQLHSFTDSQTGAFNVTLKINKFEIADIIATFQRYEYQVKYYFGEELYQNELRDNYDHLMNYLNI